MRKFSKILTLFILFFIFIFTMSFSVKAQFVRSGMAYFISSQFGEDASTQIGINYHSEQTNTYVMYTLATDTEFSNEIMVTPTCTMIDFDTPPVTTRETHSEIVYTGYPSVSYECEANIEGLTPDTEYLYYVTDGITKSKVCKFKTAPTGNKTYTFGYCNDTQVYGAESTSNSKWVYYNKIYKNIFDAGKDENTPIDFVLGGGDMVEHGAEGDFWSILWNNDLINETVFMSVIGNHEYNNSLASSSTVDGRFYSVMYNNPKNGCNQVFSETTFWFKYDDTLFVFLGSSENKQKQLDWLEQTLKNNTCQWIITCVHANPQSTNQAATSREFTPLFDKYGVDLCLFGDEHVYKIYNNYYNYKKSTGSGTTYIEMYAVANMTKYEANKAMTSKVTVSRYGISIKTYDYNNAVVDTVNISPKRCISSEIAKFNENILKKSIKTKPVNGDRTKATLTLPNMVYGNLTSFNLTTKGENPTELCSGCVYSLGYNSFNLSNLTIDTNYECTFNYTMKDGTTGSFDYDFSTFDLYYGDINNLEVVSDANGCTIKMIPRLDDRVKAMNLYCNGKFLISIDKTARRYIINSSYLNKYSSNEIEIKLLLNDDTEISYEQVFYGDNIEHNTVTFDSKNETSIKKIEFKSLEEVQMVEDPFKEGYVFKGWYENDTLVESISEVRDYNLVAKWDKIYKIEFTNTSYETIYFTQVSDITLPTPTKDGYTFLGFTDNDVLVNEFELKDYVLTESFEKIEEKTESKKKKGCNNAMTVLTHFVLLAGVIILRKRKF